MKKEKGFTLIELLAVIVILAILMVIAIPKILNVIEKTRESSAESSIKLVKDAIKTQIASGNLIGNNFEKDEQGCYNFNFDDQKNGNAKELQLKNKEQITGAIKYCNGDFSEDTLVFNGVEIKENTKKIVCKRATTLHTEECTQTYSTKYCSGAGYTTTGTKGTSTITYGNLGTKGVLKSGDAFDCDVNGDGVYDEDTERFYYVSDYYNTTTKTFESDVAVLIYYSNVGDGSPNKDPRCMYSSEDSFHGPEKAVKELPTTSQWSNISLKHVTRSILNEKGTNTAQEKILPSNYSYEGYSARFLTTQELEKACNITVGSYKTGELDSCNYLMENTLYSSKSKYSYWLENPNSENYTAVWRVDCDYRYLSSVYANSTGVTGARPIIEISKSGIEY